MMNHFLKHLFKHRKIPPIRDQEQSNRNCRKKGSERSCRPKCLNHIQKRNSFKLQHDLLRRRQTPIALSPQAQLKQKIQNALLRKGYSFDIIKQALENIDFDREEDEWADITESIGEKAWRRYSSKFSGRDLNNRVKQAMYQKGIPFDRIDAFIEKKENEEDDGE